MVENGLSPPAVGRSSEAVPLLVAFPQKGPYELMKEMLSSIAVISTFLAGITVSLFNLFANTKTPRHQVPLDVALLLCLSAFVLILVVAISSSVLAVFCQNMILPAEKALHEKHHKLQKQKPVGEGLAGEVSRGKNPSRPPPPPPPPPAPESGDVQLRPQDIRSPLPATPATLAFFLFLGIVLDFAAIILFFWATQIFVVKIVCTGVAVLVPLVGFASTVFAIRWSTQDGKGDWTFFGPFWKPNKLDTRFINLAYLPYRQAYPQQQF
ncbi:hypothetical protein T439DRAFT_357733 [Meredithblackwellia eburnea MCA 4105]